MVSGRDQANHANMDGSGQAGCAGGFVRPASQMRLTAVIAGKSRPCRGDSRGNRPAWDSIPRHGIEHRLNQRHRPVAAQRVRFICEHIQLSPHSLHNCHHRLCHPASALSFHRIHKPVAKGRVLMRARSLQSTFYNESHGNVHISGNRRRGRLRGLVRVVESSVFAHPSGLSRVHYVCLRDSPAACNCSSGTTEYVAGRNQSCAAVVGTLVNSI